MTRVAIELTRCEHEGEQERGGTQHDRALLDAPSRDDRWGGGLSVR
jgi:hypothetical protein